MQGQNLFTDWVQKFSIVRKNMGLFPRKILIGAVICEHSIMHYNYGWANGFFYDIEYWEFWNEPDIDPDESEDKRYWRGTAKQFYEFYNVALKHLKYKFSELKIGGPAVCGLNDEWLEGFFKSLKTKPDFFSCHCYSSDSAYLISQVRKAREMLDKFGFNETESILNEWNYVKDWTGDTWIYTIKSEKSIKGAAFIDNTMCACQYEPVNNLMYCDARPCAMNGMFNTDFVNEC